MQNEAVRSIHISYFIDGEPPNQSSLTMKLGDLVLKKKWASRHHFISAIKVIWLRNWK